MNIRSCVALFLLTGVLSGTTVAGELTDSVIAGNKAGVEAALAKGASIEEAGANGCTALCWAAAKGNAELVTLLLARGANPNAAGVSGYTPLHGAAASGNVAIMDLLLAKGANVNAREQYQDWTPLHRAIYANKPAAIARLLSAGAGADTLIGPVGDAAAKAVALQYAAQTGSQVLVEAVVARGADLKAVGSDKRTALHYATRSGNLVLVQWLVAKGLDVNADAGYEGMPIHGAALSGNLALVQWLVTKGANVKAVDGFGRTVLHQAATSSNRPLVEWLVTKGADVNAKSNSYGTVVQFAAAGGSLEIVQFLVARGADLKVLGEYDKTVMHYAASSGKLALVQWLATRGVSVNASSTYKDTPLHKAITNGNAALVAWMIQQGADVNAKSTHGGTPVSAAIAYRSDREILDVVLRGGANLKASEGLALCAAAGKADDTIFQWLVAQGLDVRSVNDNGETTLHIAAANKNVALAEWLLGHGVDIGARDKSGNTPLHAAARADVKTIEYLLSKGADVNAANKDGNTPLHVAANADVKTLEFLLSKGANINVANNDGETPLFVAASADRLDNLGVLVAHRAQVDARDKKGRTALLRAAYYNRAGMITALLAAGADVNAKDSDGKTPFMTAITDGKPDVIAALLKGGANVNIAESDGDTALMSVAYKGNLTLVQLLLDAGAQINARATNGDTALSNAISGGSVPVMALLLDKGADVSAKGGYSVNTALHRAASDGKLELVQALLAHRADVNALDKDGATPLFGAAYYGHAEVVKALLAAGANPGALNTSKQSALYQVVNYGKHDAATAELLLAKGGAAVFGDFEASFISALQYDRTELVKIFLAHGASASMPLSDGRMPLAIAANTYGSDPKESDPKGTIALLVSRGANVKAAARDGSTALHDAARGGWPAGVEALLAAGADVNAKADHGYTPLHEAARVSSAKKETVQSLLAHGADINARTDETYGNRTPMQMTDSISDAKARQEIIDLLQAAAIKKSGSPRETLKQMLADFKGHVANESLRRTIVKLAREIKPAVAIPDEAGKANGRAQYLFRSAETEDEYLDVAKQYLQAIEAAPWVPDYYFNLCVILEKTQYVKQALHACRLYLEVAPLAAADDVAKIKSLLSGVEFAQEQSIAKMRNRTLYYDAIPTETLYALGGESATVGGQTMALKIAVDWQAAPPKYQLMVACMRPEGVWTGSFDLVDTDTTVNRCNQNFHLVIKSAGEGFADLSDWGGNGSIRTTLDGLFDKRRKALAQSPVYAGCEYGEKTVCKTYVNQMQGGTDKKAAGSAYYESDCVGNLLRKDLRAMPANFVTRTDSEGYSGNSGNFRYVAGAGEGSYGQKPEELRACTDRFNSAVGAAYKDWGKDEN